MRSYLKITTAAIIGTITIIMCMAAILFAGNWLITTLEITAKAALDIAALFLCIFQCILYAIFIFTFIVWGISAWIKKRKQKRQEGEECEN